MEKDNTATNFATNFTEIRQLKCNPQITLQSSQCESQTINLGVIK